MEAKRHDRIRDLQQALRDRVVKVAVPGDFGHCRLCNADVWSFGEPENHTAGCLAKPADSAG